MRKLITSVKSLIAAMIILPITVVTAQYTGSYQMASLGYTYGATPAGTSVADANSAYDYWKTNFVTSSQACGYRRVIFDYYSGGLGKTDRSQTVSEGIAYGMLLSAYRGDRSLFDDLWSFYKAKRNSNGVMNWKIENCTNTLGQNGASDAELDVAMALIIASEQWQTDGYLTDAKSLIKIIREKEFEGNVLKPGDQFGGSNLTNPSYFSPAYYRVFKNYDGNATFWDAASASGYATIAGSPGASRGLVPDWSTSAGGYSNEAGSYTDQGKSFFFDAVRTPFRSAIDYLWHNNASALSHLNKFNTWAMGAHSNNIANTGSKYDMNGNKTQVYHNATFSACFSVAAMAVGTGGASQAYLNSGYNDLKNVGVGYGEYFNATFKAIGLFVMSGNFYLPKQCINKPNLGVDKSLCAGASQALSTTAVSGATYTWKKDGAAIAGSTNSLTVTAQGEYELTMSSGTPACAARDKVVVFPNQLVADFIAVAGPGSLTVTNNTLGGVSTFNYTITQPAGSAAIPNKTTADFNLTSIANGKYTIKLDVTNSGFGAGCTATNSITKVIAIGNGIGAAIDDFASASNDSLFPFAFGAKIKPIPVTYCSFADVKTGKKACPVFDCGIAKIDCSNPGTSNPWDAFGVTFKTKPGTPAPYDLTTIPFVSIRARASKPVTVGVKLNQKVGNTVDFTNNSSAASRMALTTSYQVFNLDFSLLKSGYNNATSASATIAAWNSVAGIQILPFDVLATYDGIIDIDYIIVGAKGIPAPTFNAKQDANGYTDYSTYLKDYYPTNSKYTACTPATSKLPNGTECYGSVPDWKKQVSLCGTSAVLEAKTCTATDIRWYKGAALLGTGSTYTATSSGQYIVELSNIGGITRDTVQVTARNLVPDFKVIQDNFDVKFENSSKDFTSWVWDFGNATNFVNKIGQTTVWDPSQYTYPSAGIYTVKLTVKDSICNPIGLSVSKVITTSCTAPTAVDVVGPTKTTFCSGEKATYTVVKPTGAGTYKWFFPTNATAVFATLDSLSVELTYGLNSTGKVKYEAYANCLNKKSGDSISVISINPVVANFTIGTPVDDKFTFTSTSTDAEVLTWTFPAGASSLTSSVVAPVVSLKSTGTKSICLKADNTTCKTTKTICKDVTVTIVGLLENQELSATFVAYPNPVMGGKIEFSKTINNVVIIDALGTEISSGSQMTKLDVSSYNAGIYFIKSDEGTVRVVVK